MIAGAKGLANGTLFTGGQVHQRLRRPKVIWHTDVMLKQNKRFVRLHLLLIDQKFNITICIHYYLHRLSFRSRLYSGVLSACNVIQRPLEVSSWVV
jgi:hypothetical protein